MSKYHYAQKRKQPFYSFVKVIMRWFYKRPKIELTDGPLPERCIMVANHYAKSGPAIYNLYLPRYYVTWGAHEMLGNYHSRKAYLRDVYYIQKRHRGKLFASFCASFEAIFSPMFYKGIKVLPTYHGAELRNTINDSIDCLKNDVPVLIFPEDSSDGYHDKLRSFFSGFILLAEQYFKRTGEDVPVVPIYYTHKHPTITIGGATSIQALKARGLDRQQIAEFFCQQVNALAR